MKTLFSTLALVVGLSVFAASCVYPGPRRGPHVAVGPHGVSAGVAGVNVGVYDTLPAGYNSPYYYYGNRYYYGGRWETGRFRHGGRYYDGRYFHNGRYIYGGRYAPGPAVRRR